MRRRELIGTEYRIYNSVYSLTVGTTPQAVFICLGSTFSVAFVCSWMIKPHVSWKVENEDAAGAESGD